MSEHKPIVLLLGAGASMPAGIPNVTQFSSDFQKWLLCRKGPTHELTVQLNQLTTSWENYHKSKTTDQSPQIDLERLNELLTYLDDPTGDSTTLPLRLPEGFPKPSRSIELLAWELKKYIQKRCLGIRNSSLKYLEPLREFFSHDLISDVITLNYDICLEKMLKKFNLAWDDGFNESLRQSPASLPCFQADQRIVRIIKLHGSVSWYREDNGHIRRLLGSSQRSISLRFGKTSSMTRQAMMIYPTLRKSLGSGPFPTLITSAQKALNDAKLLISIGYAFADQHIRELVLDALSRNEDMRLVIVDPQPETPIQRLLKSTSRPLPHVSISAKLLIERIGVPSHLRTAAGDYRYGYVQTALSRGWLLARAQDWLAGRAVPQLHERLSLKLKGKGRPWELIFELSAGLPYITFEKSGSTEEKESASNPNRRRTPPLRLWAATQRTRRLLHIDLRSGFILDAPPMEIPHLRGLGWDEERQLLFVIQNIYSLCVKRTLCATKFFEGKKGLGRLWSFSPTSGQFRPLTRMSVNGFFRLITLLTVGRRHDAGLREVLKTKSGFLLWPTRILLDRFEDYIYITEATDLVRYDMRRHRLEYLAKIPLCMNLTGIDQVSPHCFYLVDAGIHPFGRGRLLFLDLRTASVKLLVTGKAKFADVLFHSDSGVILVSNGLPWPEGEVVGYSGDSEAQTICCWKGLDRPQSLICGESGSPLLVGTARGIVELSQP